MTDSGSICCCLDKADYSPSAVVACPAKLNTVSTYVGAFIPLVATLYYITPPIYFLGASVILIGSAAVYYNQYNAQEQKVDSVYKPLPNSFIDYPVLTKWILDAKVVIADPEGEQINITDDKANLIILNNGSDIVKASLCKLSKAKDKYVDTIYGFDPQKDKLNLHCTKRQVSINDIEVVYQNQNKCFEIQGAEDKSVLCFVGDSPELSDVIYG